MRFAYGATRWVILTDRYAIKVARIRLIHPFVRFLKLLLKTTPGEDFAKYGAHKSIRTGLKVLVVGILANRTEHRLYKLYSSDLLAPTLFTICWFVNVQVCGKPATDRDVRGHYFWDVLQKDPLSINVLRDDQFCIIKNRACLADYGREELEPFLAAYLAA